VVTLSLNYGFDARGRKPPAPVTITDPEKGARVTGIIDHLPPSPTGTYNCPAGYGTALDLAFRARPGGPVLATAAIGFSGCGTVDLTVGKQDYARGKMAGGRSTAAQVLTAAGVPWKLPPFLWGMSS
jgi:hypothetical protein